MQAFTFLNYWKGSKDPVFMNDQEEDDDGPFFDLVFTLPDNETDNGPSLPDDLFCLSDSETVSKTPFPTYSLLRSATMLRIFSLSFNKSKLLRDSSRPEMRSTTTTNNNNNSKRSTINKNLKSFTVKFKVEEVPIMSLFTKNSTKSSKNPDHRSAATKLAEEGKKLTKERVEMYLKKVKPLYIHVSKRYVGFSSDRPVRLSSSFGVNEEQRQRQRQEKGLQGVVGRHLGKSRSASSAARSPPPRWTGDLGVRRRDDSLVFQEDGIQSAILHCKRSFNASSGVDSLLLSRSVSDPMH